MSSWLFSILIAILHVLSAAFVSEKKNLLLLDSLILLRDSVVGNKSCCSAEKKEWNKRFGCAMGLLE